MRKRKPHSSYLGAGGRIYDPTLGRFLQADPFVQAPKNSQNLNRYSYVLNNPLSYTDPSGYFFESLMKNWGRLIAKYYRVIFAVAISYATFGAASAAGWGLAASGAAAGAAGGAVLTGTLEGAFYGGQLGYSLGTAAAAEHVFAEFLGDAEYYQGLLEKLWDGRAGHDFMAAGTGNWSRLGTGAAPLTTEFMQAATVAGYVSVQTDRKFKSGGESAAASYSFNEFDSMVVDEDQGYVTNSGVSVSYGATVASGMHRYRIRAKLCSLSTVGCDENYADVVFDYVNRNDIPFIDNDIGSGPRTLLPSLFGLVALGRQPILHIERPGRRESFNWTREGHMFHKGAVRHRVFFDSGGLFYEVLGEGSGENPQLNNFAGMFLFRRGVEEVQTRFRK